MKKISFGSRDVIAFPSQEFPLPPEVYLKALCINERPSYEGLARTQNMMKCCK